MFCRAATGNFLVILKMLGQLSMLVVRSILKVPPAQETAFKSHPWPVSSQGNQATIRLFLDKALRLQEFHWNKHNAQFVTLLCPFISRPANTTLSKIYFLTLLIQKPLCVHIILPFNMIQLGTNQVFTFFATRRAQSFSWLALPPSEKPKFIDDQATVVETTPNRYRITEIGTWTKKTAPLRV